jgi:hypothetical protein
MPHSPILLSTTASSLNGISGPQFGIWEELKHINKVDPYMISLAQKLATKPKSMASYKLRDGLLFFIGRIVIPPTSTLKHEILHEFHASKLAGHSGVLCTFKRLSQNFHWKAMIADVQAYISACDVCQRNKSETWSPAELL